MQKIQEQFAAGSVKATVYNIFNVVQIIEDPNVITIRSRNGFAVNTLETRESVVIRNNPLPTVKVNQNNESFF